MEKIKIEVKQYRVVVYFENGGREESIWFNSDAHAQMFIDIFKDHKLYAYHDIQERKGFIETDYNQTSAEDHPHPFMNKKGIYYDLFTNGFTYPEKDKL